ncbi:MAG TPA: spirocyclase AveC family protein [Acidimicrobiales bacterium]
MATVTIGPAITTPGGDVTDAVPRRVVPVKWWAALGLCIVALQTWIWGSWIGSDRLATTTFGRDEVPDGIRIFAIGWQACTVVGAVWILWHWVIRPIRREGRFTLEGMLVVCMGVMYWQDPLANWTQSWFSYNTTLVNLGSWTTDVPGWLPPLGNLLPEPLLWNLCSYLFIVAPGVVFGAYVLRRTKARFPTIGKLGLIGSLFVAMAVLDLVFELIWVRFGLYVYGGAIESMTFFHGHYYQFPWYESVLYGACMAAFSSLVYFRNDKGETVAERGASDLGVSRRVRTSLRFLALLACLNVILLGYNVGTQWFALRADTWPDDVVERPYLLDGFCGPRTPYSCSGPDVPIARPSSAHLDPDGELVVPDGVSIRDESLIRQHASS